MVRNFLERIEYMKRIIVNGACCLHLAKSPYLVSDQYNFGTLVLHDVCLCVCLSVCVAGGLRLEPYLERN